MVHIKYKLILVMLFALYGSGSCIFSQEIIRKIDYAYETTDSLIFYGDTNIPLRCILSTELIFKKKSDKNVCLVRVNIDRMDIRRVIDNKKIAFISGYIYKKKPYIFDAINKYVFNFLKKQELRILDSSKGTMKGTKGEKYLNTGFFLWIYIYPYPYSKTEDFH